jgi:hypothetical protein
MKTFLLLAVLAALLVFWFGVGDCVLRPYEYAEQEHDSLTYYSAP